MAPMGARPHGALPQSPARPRADRRRGLPRPQARAALRRRAGRGGRGRPGGAGASWRASWRPTWPASWPARVEPIDAEDLAELVPLVPRTGVVAIARRPPVDLAAVLADPRAGAGRSCSSSRRNMGNIGACIRVAAAADAAGGPDHRRERPLVPRRRARRRRPALRAAGRRGRGAAGERPAAAGDRPGGGGAAPGRAAARAPSSPSAPSATGSATSCWSAPTPASAIPMRAGVSSLNLATSVAVGPVCLSVC